MQRLKHKYKMKHEDAWGIEENFLPASCYSGKSICMRTDLTLYKETKWRTLPKFSGSSNFASGTLLKFTHSPTWEEFLFNT